MPTRFAQTFGAGLLILSIPLLTVSIANGYAGTDSVVFILFDFYLPPDELRLRDYFNINVSAVTFVRLHKTGYWDMYWMAYILVELLHNGTREIIIAAADMRSSPISFRISVRLTTSRPVAVVARHSSFFALVRLLGQPYHELEFPVLVLCGLVYVAFLGLYDSQEKFSRHERGGLRLCVYKGKSAVIF